MTYIFRNITIRTKGELNGVYKSVVGKDWFDATDEEYDADEVITVCEAVSFFEDGFELAVNDGNDDVIEFDMSITPRYIVELWRKNDDVLLVDSANEVYDPESYSEYCSLPGDEIRIYDRFADKLEDYYEHSIEKENCYDRY